jgi:ATP-dependent Clp protease protease subunit
LTVSFALPAGTTEVYISFSAEIDVKTTESLIATLATCVNQGVQRVYLLLSTPGGSVMHGMNLYNVLRGLPIQLTIHNVGNIDSIGNAVFLAGSPRYTSPNSTFMFHGVGFDAQQGSRLEETSLRERLDSVLADQKRIGAIIAERTRVALVDVEPLFRQAATKDATYAVRSGFVDEIREVHIPPGATMISLAFQR